MDTWDINTYRGRLLGALQAYERKALKRGGLHPQRVQDIRVLRDCIHSIYDQALLESELQTYLSKMFIARSWGAYFWGQPLQSELKRMLEVIMADEQTKTGQLEQMARDYHLYHQVLAEGRRSGGAYAHGEWLPPKQPHCGSESVDKKKVVGAIGWHTHS